MKPAENDLRSTLARAKGLGSAKHGVGHWWYQRVTAVALIPLCLWFLSGLLTAFTSPVVWTVRHWVAQPVNTVLLALLLAAGFYHAKLGLQVVIEDYVKAPVSKYTLLLGNVFFCVGGAVLGIVAVLKIHFVG